jgi:hypothetical protein
VMRLELGDENEARAHADSPRPPSLPAGALLPLRKVPGAHHAGERIHDDPDAHQARDVGVVVGRGATTDCGCPRVDE